jgi:transposase-like protein
MRSACCPHCTNEDPTLIEALDSDGFVCLCHVCAKTFLNRSLSVGTGAKPATSLQPLSGTPT